MMAAFASPLLIATIIPMVSQLHGILISSRHIQNQDATRLHNGSDVHVGMGPSPLTRGNDL